MTARTAARSHRRAARPACWSPLVFAALAGLQFFAPGNLELMARQTAIVCMAALGMTVVIVAGGIDLSVGSIIALTHGRDRAAAAGRRSPAGRRAGRRRARPRRAASSTALLITRLRVVPFIVTLGTMLIVRGVAKGARRRAPRRGADDLAERAAAVRRDGPWSLPSGIWLVILVGARDRRCCSRYTRFGRHVFAIGSNERMARLCGVPIDRTKVVVYTLDARARRARRRAAVLEALGRRSDRRRRPRARRHRRGDHRRRQPARRPRHGRRHRDRRGIMTVIQIGCSQQGLAELGAADRHRRHHRRRRRPRPRAVDEAVTVDRPRSGRPEGRAYTSSRSGYT